MPLIQTWVASSADGIGVNDKGRQLIHSQDDAVLADACWALSHHADGTIEDKQAIIESGVVCRLVELLAHPHTAVQAAALRTVGNLVTGDASQTQVVVDCAVLPHLHTLLGSPQKRLRKEACWTLSNITAGPQHHIQAVIDADLAPPLLHLLARAEFDIREEATWVLCNATSRGGWRQINYLVQQGCLPPLCDMLTVASAKVVGVTLQGIRNILTAGHREARRDSCADNRMARAVHDAGGRSKIDVLQQHESARVRDLATAIIDGFFTEIECGVCLERIPPVHRATLPCKHLFCAPCLERWGDVCHRRSCPMCRADI